VYGAGSNETGLTEEQANAKADTKWIECGSDNADKALSANANSSIPYNVISNYQISEPIWTRNLVDGWHSSHPSNDRFDQRPIARVENNVRAILTTCSM
jgi:hypothetical protein